MLTSRQLETIRDLLKSYQQSGYKLWTKNNAKLYLRIIQEIKELRHQEYLAKKPLKIKRNGIAIKIK